MSNRNDLEYNKFTLDSGSVSIKTVGGASASSTVLNLTRADLELQKFDSSGNIRIIITL